MNLVRVALLIMSLLMVTGVVRSSPEVPCTTNEALIKSNANLQDKLSDITAKREAEATAAKAEAKVAKEEADKMRKKYEDLLEELKKKPCKV